MTLAADEARRLARLRLHDVAWERRRQRRRTAAALALVIAGSVGPVVGAWNPWNLMVVDRALDHPVLGGVLVVAGAAVVWAENVWAPRLRPAGFAACGVATIGLVVVSGILVANRPDVMDVKVVQSPFDDVEARVTEADHDFGDQVWVVRLRAGRGLATREHHVAVLAVVDRGTVPEELNVPAIVTATFPAAGWLLVRVERRVAYRLRFDPHDLGVLTEHCTTVPGPATWGVDIGCTADLDEWAT